MQATAEIEQPLTDKQAWLTSKKGNRWRRYHGLTLTLFEDTGSYRWCVADDKGPTYSSKAFATARQCLHGLRAELQMRGVVE